MKDMSIQDIEHRTHVEDDLTNEKLTKAIELLKPLGLDAFDLLAIGSYLFGRGAQHVVREEQAFVMVQTLKEAAIVARGDFGPSEF